MQHDERPEIIDGILSVRYGDRWVPVPRGGADGDPDEQAETPPEGGEGAPGDGGQPGEGGEGGEGGNAEGEGAPEGAAPQVPVGEAIQTADEDDLRTLHTQLEEHRIACRENRDVEGVRAALAEQQRIVEELNRRIAVETRTDEELAALDGQEVPTLPESRVPAGSGASAAQLAAAGPPQPRAENTPPPARPRHQAALLAAAGTEVVPAGEPMSYGQLGTAIDRAKRGRAGQTILASIPSFEEDPVGPDPLSTRNGTEVNDEFIQQAVADWWARRGARVAGMAPDYAARQGAICEPFDIIRDIPDAFVTDTPVADIFPSRPAGRGGFTFTRSGVLADVLGGVSLWDETDQANVDPDDSGTWKPCVEFDCPTPVTAILEWITACVTFDITLEMSSPERVRNLNNALNALEARIYEGRILQRIDELSHGYVFAGEYGALPTVIEAVNTVLAQLTFANRQSPGGYDLILPPGFAETLTIDRANKGFNAQETEEALAILRANLPASVNLVNSLDASLGGEPGLPFVGLPPVGNQAAAAAPDYLNGRVLRMRLVDPSAAIYAETGEMNAGVLRDANLIRQNKTGYFRERGFFLEKHGPQPWATIDVDLCADGARAALVDPTRCATS